MSSISRAVFGGTAPRDPNAPPAPPPPPAVAPPTAAPNYVFQYADGTTGSSPYRRGADGLVLTNAAGGILDEGRYMGWTTPSGTLAQGLPSGTAGVVMGYSEPVAPSWSQSPAPAAYVPPPAPAPTGGAVFGGTVSAPAPVPAPAPAPSGGLLGSAGSDDPLNRQVVAPTETIEGRIGNLLARDEQGNYTNGVLRQAAEGAMAQFAGRGLLNSSMATEAATQAAMSKAIEIAGPDAQTYFSQGRANQDAQNVFKRDDKAFGREQITLDRNQAFTREQNQSSQALTREQMAIERDKMTVSGSQFNKELEYKYAALNLDKSSQNEATAISHKNALEIRNIEAVNSAHDVYLRRMAEIDNNKDLQADVKVKMKNDAGKDFDLYAQAKGIVYGFTFGDRYSVAGPGAKAPAPEPSGDRRRPSGEEGGP